MPVTSRAKTRNPRMPAGKIISPTASRVPIALKPLTG